MYRIVTLMACAGFALAVPADTIAQEAQGDRQEQQEQDMTQPKMYENVDWVGAYYMKFKPGMTDQALQIIEDHFVTVDEQMGREGPEAYRFVTGEWDMVVYFPLEEGPGELAWEISQSGAEWNAVFMEREGGAQQAGQVFQNFSETLERHRYDLAMKPRQGMP